MRGGQEGEAFVSTRVRTQKMTHPPLRGYTLHKQRLCGVRPTWFWNVASAGQRFGCVNVFVAGRIEINVPCNGERLDLIWQLSARPFLRSPKRPNIKCGWQPDRLSHRPKIWRGGERRFPGALSDQHRIRFYGLEPAHLWR